MDQTKLSLAMNVPGPVDRVHFLDEQRRNRRASWRFSLFAAVAVPLSGLPLCILVSPLVLGLALVLLPLIDFLAPVPPAVWTAFEEVAHAAPNAWAVVRGHDVQTSWARLVAMLVLPGALAMSIAWLWILLLFRHVGAGGILLRLRARPPRRDVLHELQVANIIEEIAIAAGLPPLAVAIVDSPAANAAAVGLTIDNATILVSRGLLDLDRDARQAILAHVVGSVGNGDLKIATTILSVFQAWGLLALLIDAPFGRRSRVAIGQLIAASRNAWRNEADRRTSARMLDRLLDGAGLTFDDLFDHFTASERRHSAGRAVFVDLPLYLTLAVGAIASKAAIALFTLLVFGPWVASLWRARRRLADATAVQLTRNPDALAAAVQAMKKKDVAIEGADPVSFLFPFWPRTTEAPERDDVTAFVVGTQLEFDERMASLRKLGASSEYQPTTASGGWADVLTFLGWLVLALLLVGGCILFNVVSTSLLLWGAWAAAEWLFG